MRLAWFSPLAPVRSGIAAYSADVLPRLAADHEIDLYADEDVWRAHDPPRAGADRDGFRSVPLHGGRLYSAHDFVPRHLAASYDVVVYQLGNAPCHDYMWPYVFRYPGLVVLHDAQLHHARAKSLLNQQRAADYRAEFAACHPDVTPDVAEWLVSGLGNWAPYVWPLINHVVTASRALAVHGARVAEDLAAALRSTGPDSTGPDSTSPDSTGAVSTSPDSTSPDSTSAETPAPIHTIRMGVPPPADTPPPPSEDPRGRRGGRGRVSDENNGASARPPVDRVVFAAFGMVTPEKRIEQAIRALARIRPLVPGVRLRLVGGTVPHYDALADASRFGVAGAVELTDYVTDSDLDRHIAEADVCLCQRWPTSRETSASWLRCLAAGKPTIIDDLVHLVDVPALDPRTWLLNSTTPAAEPVAVSIDILDEQHSLELAMRKLALDGDLRARLGRAARELWAAQHRLDHMVADYNRVLAEVQATTDPAGARERASRSMLSRLPHLRADHTGLVRDTLANFGIDLDGCWSRRLPT
jgi:glycosyltransferase involved in cell wall biosynthesis